ncbi:MAG TPA: tetratricopeptide repeat protein [Candidatus Acidoferrum sp.]|nr:tetratricopeptide repeat protein [Candidatus Acidoferrum sp.]
MPVAKAQEPSSGSNDGTISGTVLLRTSNLPASQVAVKLKSHVAGVFRSVLTDLEGHFEVRSLPRSTYEVTVDEPGYEPAEVSARLDGASSKLVLYLNSPATTHADRRNYTVSVRDLKIPAKAQNEYKKGLESLTKENLAGSVEHFTKAVQAFPDYYEAFYHLGLVKTRQGLLDEAMPAFQKAIDLSAGRYAWADFGIGYVQYLEGKTDEAVTTIRRGLEVDANSADGYLFLGMAYLRLNRLDEAEKSAREALLRNPKLAQAYLLLSDVYGRQKEYLAQLQGLEAYLKLEPNGADSQNARQAREVVQEILTKNHNAE